MDFIKIKTKNIRIYPYSKNGSSRYHLTYYPTGLTCAAPGVRTKTYYKDEYEEVIKVMNELQNLIDTGASYEEICKAGKFC